MSVRPLASNTQHERPSLETGTERRHDKRLESERPRKPMPPAAACLPTLSLAGSRLRCCLLLLCITAGWGETEVFMEVSS